MSDEIESVGSRRNHERSVGWAESVAQQSVSRRPLSPNFVIDPPTIVKQDRVDKRFTTYSKTTPLFQLGEGLFSTQMPEPIIPKKQKIRKSIRVTDPPPPLTRTTFQQQETSAVQNTKGVRVPLTTLETGLPRAETEAHLIKHSPSHLPNSIKQWCQRLAKTKTDWVFRRSSVMARVVVVIVLL